MAALGDGAAGMTDQIECRHHGRGFTVQKMALLRALITAPRRVTALPCRRSSAAASAGTSPTTGSRT